MTSRTSFATQMDEFQNRLSTMRSLALVQYAVTLGIGMMLWSTLMLGIAATQQRQLSNEAPQQIQALLDEKAARTPAQQKMDSNLLLEMKMGRGEVILHAVPALQTGITMDAEGKTLV